MSALSSLDPIRKSSTSWPVGPVTSVLEGGCRRRVGVRGVVGVLGGSSLGVEGAERASWGMTASYEHRVVLEGDMCSGASC